MYPGLWFSRMLQPCTGIAAQSQYNSYSINGITIQIYSSKSHYWSLNACCHDTVSSQLLGRNMQVSPIIVYFLYFILGWVTYTLPSMLAGSAQENITLDWLFQGRLFDLRTEWCSCTPKAKFSIQSLLCWDNFTSLYDNSLFFLTFFLLHIILDQFPLGIPPLLGSVPILIFFRSLTHVLCRKKVFFFLFSEGKKFSGVILLLY